MAFVLDGMSGGDESQDDGQVLERLHKALAAFLVRTSSARLDEVTHQVSQLDEPWPEKWTAYLRSVRPRGAFGRLLNRRD